MNMNMNTDGAAHGSRASVEGLTELAAYLTDLVARGALDAGFAHRLAREVRAEAGPGNVDNELGWVELQRALSCFDAEVNRAKADGFVRALARLREADEVPKGG
ncbi:MAG TPA: hypothetical protein VF534_16235 [Paraburkholderia sp.]